MLQELMEIRGEALYKILLDLHKAYHTLDRNRCLDILAAYRVGLRSIRFLHRYWNRQKWSPGPEDTTALRLRVSTG